MPCHAKSLVCRSLATIAFAVSNAAGAQGWTFTDLGALGGVGSQAMAINSAGEITGWTTYTDFSTSAFLYSAGAVSQVGPLQGYSTAAYDINDAGVVLGATSNARIFTYAAGQAAILPGIPPAVPTAINNSGQITLVSREGGSTVSHIYDNGVLTSLGSLGGAHTYATSINDRGQVAGISYDAAGVDHPFLYADGVMTDLGKVPGSSPLRPSDINNLGQISGEATFGTGVHTALRRSEGTWQEITASRQSSATALNNKGDVVGLSDGSAFLYRDGDLTNLSGLPEVAAAGWRVLYPSDINDAGQIVGWGPSAVDGTVMTHAFLLSPFSSGSGSGVGTVPEPGTGALMLVALGWVGWSARRMRRRHRGNAGNVQ